MNNKSDVIYNYIDANIIVDNDQELQQLYKDIETFIDSMSAEKQVDFMKEWL